MRNRIRRWVDRNFLGAVVTLTAIFALLAVLLLWSAVSYANDATVNWAHPTQRENNVALPLAEIRETLVLYGLCASGQLPATPQSRVVPAPATTVTLTGLGYGTWCVAARTVDTEGRASNNSSIASKVILAPPKPPVLSSTITVAYEISMNAWGDVKLGRAVGTMPLGTACVDNPILTNKGEYYEIERSNVTMTKEPKSSIIVTRCDWA